MLKKIAVTGGVASGKTTVCRMLGELGATVIYADAIVHELLKPNTEIGKKVIHEFGTIDRKTLSEKVFKDPKALEKLESILHPAVLQKIDEEYARAKGACFVVEIPLLYEIGAEDRFDIVIAVLADLSIAKKRFEHGAAEYELRMQRQLKPEIKAAKAHIVIHNNGSLEDLRKEVARYLKQLNIHRP
ncbi:MAG: dephospho-CoA kinase [Parachlamydiales bacterium]|nr:dephospho-CoA kinase [Parachlamydiales bacterium]